MCINIVFQGGVSLLMLVSDDMWALINYMSFVQWLSVGGSIAGMLYLRIKRPDMPRPIKVSYKPNKQEKKVFQLYFLKAKMNECRESHQGNG